MTNEASALNLFRWSGIEEVGHGRSIHYNKRKKEFNKALLSIITKATSEVSEGVMRETEEPPRIGFSNVQGYSPNMWGLLILKLRSSNYAPRSSSYYTIKFTDK